MVIHARLVYGLIIFICWVACGGVGIYLLSKNRWSEYFDWEAETMTLRLMAVCIGVVGGPFILIYGIVTYALAKRQS